MLWGYRCDFLGGAGGFDAGGCLDVVGWLLERGFCTIDLLACVEP